MTTRNHGLLAALSAGALLLGACGTNPLVGVTDRGTPVADDCAPSPKPVAATHPWPPTALDIVLAADRFPLCDYGIALDEPIGSNGWSRTFTPHDVANANFQRIIVLAYLLGPGDDASAFVARRTSDTFRWSDRVPVLTEVAAEVVGDAAKAYSADFGAAYRPLYFYVTGYDGYGIELRAEPSRAGVDTAIGLAKLVAVARGEIAFANQILAAMRPSPTAVVTTPAPTAVTAPPTPKPTAPPTAVPTVRPTISPPATPTAGPAVAVQNVPCGARQSSTVMTTGGQVPLTTIYTCYDVAGDTAEAILASVKARSPVDKSGDAPGYTSIALTDSRYQIRSEISDAGGACRATSVAVTFTVTFTYPRWVPPAQPDPALVPKWNTYIASLQTHENGHRDLAVTWVGDVVTRIRAISLASCASFSAASEATQDEAAAVNRQAQVAYDAATNHGMTQRAGLP